MLLMFTAWSASAAAASSAAELHDVLGTLTDKDVVQVHAIYEDDPVIGRFIDAAGDSIRVKPTALPVVAFHRADVTQLDTSTKRSRATGWGLVAGVLVGGLVSAAILKANEDTGGTTGMAVFFVFPMSVAIGGVMGSGFVDYHWQTRWQRS